MYDLKLKNVNNFNQYEELIKLFLTPDQYCIHSGEEEAVHTFRYLGDKNQLKRELYRELSELTGLRPKWGILTGIRPVKLAGELCSQLGSEEKAKQHLKEEYLVDDGKIDLLMEIYAYQQRLLGAPSQDSVGIYIGIPFCPTRCLYCSFTSNQAAPEKIDAYLQALYKEITFTGERMADCGLIPESLYIGGGTPTTLTAHQLESLLCHVERSMDLTKVREMTVEAGRPDTITAEKLQVIKDFGIRRISINPQSMHDETLKAIGRSHTAFQTREAFRMAHEAEIPIINADLIAGLPGETREHFQASMGQVLDLGAKNITVHTLAVKRSSRLKEMDENFHYRQPQRTQSMLELAEETLREHRYRPYYLYRQKHTSGSTENLGYCKEDTLSIYNVRIMEEAQTIIALGAGGITKVYYPQENRLERVPNVSNYEIYIERIDEMLDRKSKNLFRR